MPTEENISAAPFLTRLMAGLLDYVVITAVYIFAVAKLNSPDYSFLIALVAGSIYYSLCHSSYGGGQTLGKRVFSLYVLSSLPLSITRAFFRYLLTIGVIILIIEIPHLLFRQFSLVANSILFEIPMGIGLCYFFSNFAQVLLNKHSRGVHDLLSNTAVVYANKRPENILFPQILSNLPVNPLWATFPALRFRYLRWIVSPIVALLLWLISIQRDPGLSDISANRFRLENQFKLRILVLARHEKSLYFEALILDKNAVAKTSAEQIRDFLLVSSQITANFDDIRFNLIPFLTDSSQTDSGGEEIRMSLVKD